MDKWLKYIWFNGEILEKEKALIHFGTHSLHYAGAVFEGEMAYSGKIFKLAEHTERLLKSAETLKMESPFKYGDIIEAHRALVEKNSIENAYIRPLIWRGSESVNIFNPDLSVNLAIGAVEIFSRRKTPLSLFLSDRIKPHPKSMPPQCKSSGHYSMSGLIKAEAKAAGFDDALLLDWRGYIAECTTSNIFFVEGDALVTPIADAFLDGITRRLIIAEARDLGIEVKESYISPEDLNRFDESFVTGTAVEIRSVGSIDFAGRNKIFEKSEITSILSQRYGYLTRKSN